MEQEAKSIHQHVRNFVLILVAGIFASVLGGLFGAAIAAISPEFVKGLFGPKMEGVVRYAAAVGAIWGLFIGAGAMAFCVGVAAISNWFRPGNKKETG